MARGIERGGLEVQCTVEPSGVDEVIELASRLREVDGCIDALGRELEAAMAQREAILEALGRTTEVYGLDPRDYYDGKANAALTRNE